MSDKIVLDLETKKSFDEVGGQQNAHLLEISVVGVYSYERDQYHAFKESEFSELENWLKKADLVIGFNSKKFDFAVLQPYFRWNLSKLPHLDILEEVVHALGHRLKLESVATSTLGEGKSGSGLDAIWYYKNKEWEKLIKYCLDDVRVTKEVYEYGQAHGNLWYENSGQHTPIPVRWGQEPSARTLLTEAMKFGKQIKIDYLGRGGQARQQLVVDAKDLTDTHLIGFNHAAHKDEQLAIERIFSVEIQGQATSFQTSLF
ncbi:MAG: ribonuclease H-like domain-containing protein [Candidatus Komeilibacteria bacterium]